MRPFPGLLPAAVLLLLCIGCETGHSQGPIAGAQARVTLRPVFSGQTLDYPVHLAAVPDGSGDVVVVEQAGRILRFAAGATRATSTYLDIRDRVRSGGEEGLLSIAFHPNYARKASAYVFYSAAGPRRIVVSRFNAATPAGPADAATETVLLEVLQPFSNHNGGQLAFGPDGMLYIGLGDGGSGGDPLGHGQNRTTLLGSILRIDVDRAEAGLPYGIPPDNPFVGATDGSRAEIWAYGLRNPWRFSFDSTTGSLYAADVGQGTLEEVDRIQRGDNHGWNIMEGRRCFSPSSGCATTGLMLPITEYGRSEGQSITGGFVYRGRDIAGLAGHYVFGDYASGRIWTLPASATQFTSPVLLLSTDLRISSFGQDSNGELYVLDHGRGRVFRFAPDS